jgi:glycosyltransferase involved in cell wall biosynthesis
MKSILEIHNIDVLHSHLYKSTIFNALPCRLAKVKHIATQHDSYSIDEKPIRALYLNIAKLLGTKLTAVSRSVAKSCRSTKVSIIYNGIEFKDLLGSVSKSELGFFDDDIVLTFAGRLSEIKNVDSLIYMMKLLPNNIKLIILGTGPYEYESNLKRLVKSNFLSDRVKFTGHVKDIYPYLNISHLFILPSRSEGLSMSIIEALYSSTPVIAFDVGGNSELVNNYAGKLIPYESSIVERSKSLANAVITLIKSDDLDKLGIFGRKFITDNFSFDKMMSNYCKLYNGV